MPTLNLGRVGFVNKGPWSVLTAYKINDTVTYNLGTYACILAHTGQTPVVGGSIYWQEWIANDNVKLSGDQNIAGVKTFASSPVIPDATTDTQPVSLGQLTQKDGSNTVSSSSLTKHVNYFVGTLGVNTGVISIKITGLVTATALLTDLGFMEVTITQDDRDHSSATNPASYKFMIKGNMDTGVWYNTQAILLGTNSTASINVRFTRTTTDAYIEIGETTSTWYYPTVEVAHVASYILAGYAPTFSSTLQASLLGTTATDSIIAVAPPSTSSQLKYVDATVASNALTVSLNPTVIDFRSATLSSGVTNTRSVSTAISLVVPTSATLGTTNGVSARLILIAIDNAGTVELAIVNQSGGLTLDETGLISTTAISAAATANNVIYSTTARSNVPYRIVGFIDITEATAGTWASAPTEIQGAGGQSLSKISVAGALNASGSTPMYANRAWVNFNGTGTVAIRASGNVTSITDNGGTGNYTANFTSNFPDANYAVVGTCASATTTNPGRLVSIYGAEGTGAANKTVSACQILVGNPSAGTTADNAEINLIFSR